MKDDCEYFVLSIDAANIARVVSEGHPDAELCDETAEWYYEEQASAGEEVRVLCKHHLPVLDAPN